MRVFGSHDKFPAKPVFIPSFVIPELEAKDSKMEKNTQWKESNLHQMFVNVKMEQMMSSVNVQNSAIASGRKARCHPLLWQTGGLEKMGSLGHCLYPHQPPPLSSSSGCRRSHQGGEPLLNPS
ncbi:uncharacterized protein LOC144316322 isoform X2 [Canis aureus]